MKEQLIPILLYIFDHHMKNNELQVEKIEDLLEDLETAGFDKELSATAVAWLEDIISLHKAESMHTNTESTATRVFTPEEISILSTEVRGYILYLERAGILNPVTRERVLNRLISVDEYPIEVEHVKLVTMLVLEHEPEKHQAALQSMEELLYATEEGGIH